MDSKRTVASKIKKRLSMLGPKFTAGYHLAELETLNQAAVDCGIQLPDNAAFALRLLRAAARRGYIMPPVTIYSVATGDGINSISPLSNLG